MEGRVLFSICAVAAVIAAAILLIAYGEQRAAHHCLAMVTEPINGK